ncbi:nuclear transport factor 2 family protein [Vibrio sp.]|uniref:nuclear transport factor 2 family protein n=1 Tax=Vibrio sp. TaxID=678 RepID=UPI003D0A8655
MNKDIQEISELAQKYFDALYFGKSELFAEIFHPQAGLHCNTDDQHTTMDVATYLELVAGRAAPAETNQPRRDEVLSIQISSPTTAVLQTRELFVPKLFTDDLTLMKFNGEWKIIAKIWHYDLVENLQD